MLGIVEVPANFGTVPSSVVNVLEEITDEPTGMCSSALIVIVEVTFAPLVTDVSLEMKSVTFNPRVEVTTSV